MATQQTLPPDVLFAQKASAVVKAAGLDPRAMDLERFRQMAPIVFTRAYEAIYNETVVENSNATYSHEQSTNAQIIIDRLIKRTNNPALSGLKGKDVCEGSHRAIGVLVGVLFAEGQRLWLEKLQKSNGNGKKKKKLKKFKKVVEDNVTESILPSNDDPSSRMLKRINHIKQQLASNDDAFVKEQSDNIVSTEELLLREKKKIKKMKSVPQTDEEEQQQGESTRKSSKSRPSSAPQTRRPLYPTPVQVTDRLDQQTPEKKKNYDSNLVQPFTYDLKSGRKIWLTPEQIQAIEIQRKKAMLGNIHSLPDQADENENDYDNNENKVKSPKRPTSAGLYRREERPTSPPARTEPMWPGQSTEKSVDEWLRKMRRQRLLEEVNQNKFNPELLRPRSYHSYNKMQERDIIISIEHCHNCQAHNSTLRHDEAAYENQANSMLKNLAQIVHSCCVAVRVGVVRFKANITSKCKYSDANTRIGAFEIQVAYKSLTGKIYPELLHSKLISRNWPSKSVLEKRLKTYLSKLQIPTFAYNENMEYEGQDSEGLDAYPVGAGGWNSTKLADPMWSYIPPETPKTTEKSEDDKNDNSKTLQFIQWVYDSRKQATLPMFPLGTTVSVSSIKHPKGGVERYPLVGVIQAYSSNFDISNQSIVSIRLKYHSSEISVPLHDCDYLHESLSVFESIPRELEALLLLAKHELSKDSKSIAWRVMDTEDKKEKIDNIECIFLGRSSYFHQIRNLVWDLESELTKKNGNHLEAKHPKTGELIDLQLAYSEPQIDWVFSVYGKLANMTELENFNIEKEIESKIKQVPDLKESLDENTKKVSSRSQQEPKIEKEIENKIMQVPNLNFKEVLDENTKKVSSRSQQQQQEPKSGRLSGQVDNSDNTALSERPASARPVSARPAVSARPNVVEPEASSSKENNIPDNTIVPNASRPESARSKSNTPTSSRLKEDNVPDNAIVPNISRPASARSKSNTPRSKENNHSDVNIKSKSTPTSARNDGDVNYENSGFEEYGDDFDEPDDKNVTGMKDSLNDRYAALMNEDDNDDDIDYNNL